MVTSQEIMQRMKEIQQAREVAFGPLAEVLGRREELHRQLAELDEPYAKAYVAAEAGGWTSEELAAIGAEEPAKRPKGRPRKRVDAKKGAASTAQEPASGGTVAASPATVPEQGGSGEEAAVSLSG